MSDKKINFNYALSFIEELPDEVLTTFVGGAGSATSKATPSSTSGLGNATNGKTGSSITKVAYNDPKAAKR
jgi:hypothetical protein